MNQSKAFEVFQIKVPIQITFLVQRVLKAMDVSYEFITVEVNENRTD